MSLHPRVILLSALLPALMSLGTAQAELKLATHDKGGHRARAMKLIEQAQAEVRAGIEFDRTADKAESWGAWREYRCAQAPWLKVDANAKPAAEGCRRVKVGEKTVPVYELRCGEDDPSSETPL